MRTDARLSADSIAYIPSICEIEAAMRGLSVSIMQLGGTAYANQLKVTEENLQFVEQLLLEGELCTEGLSIIRACLTLLSMLRLGNIRGSDLGDITAAGITLGARFVLIDRGLRKASFSG